MRVVEVVEFGGPEVLRIGERPDPRASDAELVVRIHAATVNPTDLGARSGQARRRMPDLSRRSFPAGTSPGRWSRAIPAASPPAIRWWG